MKKLILVFLFLTFISYSQKETGFYVEIKGHDFIKNANNTEWYLAKIIKGKGLFKRFKKPKPYEEMEISFKDGIITYKYKKDNREVRCNYFLADLTGKSKDEYMYITVECPVFKYDWLVYRLSDEKLVISIGERYKDDYHQTDLGRYVFYRKK